MTGVNITTNFPSLASLDDARTSVLSTSLPLITAMNYAHQAYNNAFYYSYSSYDARSSSKVAGTLTNGDYGIAYGSSLTAYPSTLTQGDYTFAGKNVAVTFYGSVSQANASAYKTGYLNKIIVSSGQAKVTMNGYDDISTTGDSSLSNFTVQNGQASLSGVGNFTVKGSGSVSSIYQSSISGTLSSITLSSGSNSITIGGSIDLKSLSSYSSFTDFLAATMNGNDKVTGTNASEYLMGYAGNDTLNAGGGDDTLNGGMGNDILDGGLGSNTAVYGGYKSSYIVSKNGTSYTISDATDGTDTLNNIQFLKFADGTIAIDSSLIGSNSQQVDTNGNDSIADSDKTLEGSLGADTLVGGNGDDLYIVNNKGDKIIEKLDAGTDSVLSSITYALGNNLENLELIGVAKINATGNALDNWLSGNDGNNVLNGMAGNDILIGGLGSDKLTGGKGMDTFEFKMDDFFPVDENGDYIFNKSVDSITDFNLKEGDILNFDGLQFYPDLASAKADEPQLFYVKGTIYLNIDTTALKYSPVAIIKLTGNPKVNADFTDFDYPI